MNRNQNKLEKGFTVTELLVVFFIMVMISSIVIINWNKQTPNRNLTLAQNEMITNIRKIQGYAVSSRNINAVQSAKYYIMSFVQGSNQYLVYGIDSSGVVTGVLETMTLPQGVNISSVELVNQNSGAVITYDCAYLIFSVIYGKTYLLGNSLCSLGQVTALVDDPPALAVQSNYDFRLQFSHTQSGNARGVQVDSRTGNVQVYTP